MELARRVQVPALFVADHDRVLRGEAELCGERLHHLVELCPGQAFPWRDLEVPYRVCPSPCPSVGDHVVQRLLASLQDNDFLVFLTTQHVVSRPLRAFPRPHS